MKAVLRKIRLIQIALLASVALYVVIGERATRQITPKATFYYAVSFASISLVGGILVVRRTLVLQSEIQLLKQPDDSMILARLKSGYIVTYALCEALALFGLVLRILGFPLSNVWAFYFGSFALLLLFSPRVPRPQAS